MAEVYVGLGSNLGDRLSYLRQAVEGLRGLGSVAAVSSVYETEPVGEACQGMFLNAVVLLRTALEPRPLLHRFLAIEVDLGRRRERSKGPRTLDLDLLFYEDRVISEPGLVVPHAALHERAFVLYPLTELAPALRHPLLGRDVAALREALLAGQGVAVFAGPGWATPS